MTDTDSEIEKELALVNYLNDRKMLDFEQAIKWVGKRYSDASVFQRAMMDSTSIADVIATLSEEYSIRELSEDFMLSKIAAEYFDGELNLMETINKAYGLLNVVGDGRHDLSFMLYCLIDVNSHEGIFECERRARTNNFDELLNKCNTGEYQLVYQRVFHSE